MMNLRFVKSFNFSITRLKLGIMFGIWVAISLIYYWWLISRLSIPENRNNKFRNYYNLQPHNYRVQGLIESRGIGAMWSSSVGICETIHIVMVCMAKCTHIFTPMLKSLLHHRQNPIHFYFLVDTNSEHRLTTLMDSWDLPDVTYSCLNVNADLDRIRWIPNSHYAGIYGLAKLLVPEVLPRSVDQVIMLDLDLTFVCDVYELWAMFRNMTHDQFLGLVENESNWYYDTEKNWPAIGRGYNTGIMLVDLRKIRKNGDWNTLWYNTVNTHLMRLKKVSLADQDIINAMIKNDPKIVYNISCQYNIQMSTQSLAKSCYGDDINNVKIIHWNSPSKYNIKLKDAETFKNIYLSYVNFDGHLLRRKLFVCSKPEDVTYKVDPTDLCFSFRIAQRVKLRTHLYYMDYDYTSSDNFDVTLVVQLSMDRLQFLVRLAKEWEGPLSAAIYLSECEVRELEQFVANAADTFGSRTDIGFHLVFKHDDVHYPVNYLRNVALENVNTPYVFLMDVDFVPSAGLYAYLRQSIQLVNPYPQKMCLVVAAFESGRYRGQPPRSKTALISALQREAVGQFRAREWPPGHRATDYPRWISATTPYEVQWQSDYEPYLVVHRSVPKYDTRFSGFGWNKVSHSVHLQALGYRPIVLPDSFVVHTPHAPSLDITAFRANPHYRICLALLKNEFMAELKAKYNVTLPEVSKSDSPYYAQAKNLFNNQNKAV